MKPLAFGFGLAAFAATSAAAGPQSVSSPLVAEVAPKERRVNLRLVEDRVSDPSPIRNSGMIVQRTIAPNTVLGVGLFKMAPKKLGSGDLRLDGPAPKSRKAAVSLRFTF